MKTNKTKSKTENKKSQAELAGEESRKVKRKKRLLMNLFFSSVLPLTVCFFGPFEIYAGNLDEFSFSLGDFIPLCLLFALAVWGVLFGLLCLLKRTPRKIAYTALVWLSLMAFLQRNYLNMGINALTGDGVGTATVDVGSSVINLLVWLLVGGLLIFLTLKFKKGYPKAITLVSLAILVSLLGAQTVGFLSVSLKTDVYVPVNIRNSSADNGSIEILTYDGITDFSKNKNVVMFIVDRFDEKFYEVMAEEDPEFFSRLDGFTHFSDYTSLYCRTYPAVASIITGKDHDFNMKKDEAFDYYYSDGGNVGLLSKSFGYDIALYTEKSYVYNDASVMADYVVNTSVVNDYYIDSHRALAGDMLRLSLSQYLPIAAKWWAGWMSTASFNSHAVYEKYEAETDTPNAEDPSGISKGDEYTCNESSTAPLYEYIDSQDFSADAARNRFTLIHLFGCHDIYNTKEESVRAKLGDIEETFEIIYRYLDEMKRLGIYDDATIIITGDHGSALSDSKMIGEAASYDDGTRVTAMLFKPSGASGEELRESSAQISQDELWNTIFSSEKLPVNHGETFFDISEDEDRERRYLFEIYKNAKNNDLEYNQVIEYKIRGTAREGGNWEIVSRTDIIK